MSQGSLGSASFAFQATDAEFAAVAKRVEATILALQQKVAATLGNLFGKLQLPKIVPQLDASKITAAVDALVARLNIAPIVSVAIDTTAVTSAIESIRRLVARALRIPIEVDTSRVVPEVERVKAAAELTPPVKLKVQVDPASSAAVRAQLANLTAGHVPAITTEQIVKLKADDAEAAENVIRGVLERTQARIQRLSVFATRGLIGGGIAIGLALKAAAGAESASARLDATLRATGNAAGFTGNQLRAMAVQIQRTTAFEDDAVVAAQALLATFRNIRGTQFVDATKAALDLSTVLGQDLHSSILQIGKALDTPGEGLEALGRAGVRFTDSQRQMIQAMARSGDVIGAQRLILDRLAATMGGAAVAAANTFAGRLAQLRAAVNDLGEALGGAILPSLTAFVQRTSQTVATLTGWISANQTLVARIVAVTASVAALAFLLPRIVGGITAVVTVLRALGGAIGFLGGPLSALLVAGGAVAAVFVRMRITGESFTESAYQSARALGFFHDAVQNAGAAMVALGRASNDVKDAQRDLANARTLDDQAAAAARLSASLAKQAAIERDLLDIARQKAAAPKPTNLPPEQAARQTFDEASDVATHAKRVQLIEQQAKDAQGLADRLNRTSAAQAQNEAAAQQESVARQREVQATLREIYRSQLSDRERAREDFEAQLAKEVDALRANDASYAAVQNFIFHRRQDFAARQNDEDAAALEERNRIFRDANAFLGTEQDRALAQFQDQVNARVDSLRAAGDSEADVLAFINQAYANFGAEQDRLFDDETKRQTDQRRDLLRQVELLGKDSGEQRRINLQHEKEDAIERAKQYGLSQQEIIDITKKFDDELNKTTDDARRRAASVVGLTDLFNQLNVAAVNAAGKVNTQAGGATPPGEPNKPESPKPPLPAPPDRETVSISKQQLETQQQIAESTSATRGFAEQTLSEVRRISTLPATLG
jgi:hypothetical protein